MEHHQPKWGRPRDDVYGPYDWEIHNAGRADSEGIQRTLQPTVTGTSVIGIKFDKGVIVAADNLASYGSLRRFTDQERLLTAGDNTVVGVGGDVSDLQAIEQLLDNLEIEEAYDQPAQTLAAPHIHAYLQRVMYQRRSKMDPLWNALLVGGLKPESGEPFLAYIDMLGVTYQSGALATGFGSYLAVPLLRKLVDKQGDEKSVTEAQARAAIDECMKVLFYRDGRALDKYSVATVTADGVNLEQNIRITGQSWKMARDVRGFGGNQYNRAEIHPE